MNDTQALQKWCPFARVAQPDGGPYNRTGDVLPIEALCVTDECMMWVGSEEEGDCGLKK